MKSLIFAVVVFGSIALSSLGYHFWLDEPVAIPETVTAPIVRGVYILESEKHFGTVGLNEDIQGTFTVVNDSDRAITLSEPMKSCSCTSAELGTRELAAGERCTLTFAVKTGSRRVPRVETIGLVYTHEGREARQIFAKVYFVPKGVFEVDPSEVVLTKAQPKATFRVQGNPAANFHAVLDVRSNHRCVKVNVEALPIVTVELDLDTPDESILNVECVVYTNNPAEDTIRIPVRVR